MIRKLLLLSILTFCIACGSSRKTVSKTSSKRKTTEKVVTNGSKKANAIVKTALAYNGTRYKFGGTTRKGMDCSGLMYVSFGKHNVSLPRVSYQQAKRGKRIKVSSVKKGDLLFFKTNKNRNRINHVGLVVENRKGTIKFIHATTSKGVLVSSLKERYWKNAFTEARRLL